MKELAFLGFLSLSLASLVRLPDLPEEPTFNQYAGFLNVDATTNSNIFYYFFESSMTDPLKSPVTLWLNGGPGASSMMGAFIELGPYNIQLNATLAANPFSWNQRSNLLFLDQPVGTGFSYTDSPAGFPTSEDEVAAAMWNALQLFFAKYPAYAQLDFYITGESYAGKYIPSLATYIHNKNQGSGPSIRLKGLAIGNGWVHPISQNQAYVDYPYTTGLIDSFQRAQAQLIQDNLTNAILSQQWDLANDISNDLEAYVTSAAGNIDLDNILYPVDPIDAYAAALSTYLNSAPVRAALNVGDHTWTFENMTTSNYLNADEQQSVLHLLPNLIENYRVLIYTGNLDMNCNLWGVDRYLDEMNWVHKKEFYAANRVFWKVKGELAGYARSWGNLKENSSLTALIVRNAGHEVPFYQPQNSLDLFNRFISGQPWSS